MAVAAVSAAGAVALLSACGPADLTEFTNSASLGEDLCARAEDSVCATDDANLIAAQNIDAGSVRIDNDGTNLLIQVTADSGWLISEVHIFAGVGSAPVNKKGTVVPGHFPFNQPYATPVSVHTLAVPLASLGIGCGDTLNTVVHAVVRKREAGGGFQEETAFGDGAPLHTTRWGFSSTREICCELPTTTPPPAEDCPRDMNHEIAAAANHTKVG